MIHSQTVIVCSIFFNFYDCTFIYVLFLTLCVWFHHLGYKSLKRPFCTAYFTLQLFIIPAVIYFVFHSLTRRSFNKEAAVKGMAEYVVTFVYIITLSHHFYSYCNVRHLL